VLFGVEHISLGIGFDYSFQEIWPLARISGTPSTPSLFFIRTQEVQSIAKINGDCNKSKCFDFLQIHLYFKSFSRLFYSKIYSSTAVREQVSLLDSHINVHINSLFHP
jgi:hypothetical protein